MKEPYWNKKWGKNSICGISHARLRPGSNKQGVPYCVFLPCKHGFYLSVLQVWYHKHNTCPMCRTEFTLKYK